MSDHSLNTSNANHKPVDPIKNGAITSMNTLIDSTTKSKNSNSNADKQARPTKEGRYSATIAGLYRLTTKLGDELRSEAAKITHKASKKAAAMVLTRLSDSVDAELEAFDKKVEDSKEWVTNTEVERGKIVNKKDKYQDMIEQLAV